MPRSLSLCLLSVFVVVFPVLALGEQKMTRRWQESRLCKESEKALRKCHLSKNPS